MTITFENDNDIVLYALERVISHASRTGQIFMAQWVWWLASVIGLEQGLILYINNLQKREQSAPLGDDSGTVHPDRAQQI